MAWQGFTEMERRKLLRDISPYMPEVASQEFIIVDGKREDVHGACRLMPEMTLRNLAPTPEPLLTLMRRYACTELEDMILDEVPFVEGMLERWPGWGMGEFTQQQLTMGFAFVQGTHLGREMVLTKPEGL